MDPVHLQDDVAFAETRLFAGRFRVDVGHLEVLDGVFQNFLDLGSDSDDGLRLLKVREYPLGDVGVKIAGEGVLQLVVHVAYIVIRSCAVSLAPFIGVGTLAQVDLVVVSNFIA